ncbi:hypothetical protein B0H13DRAFT_2344235 [Mycena leptocephala]|nr:hypothetical protein B0H13DRAFT_2344235 [Mycena leptocephala]
MSTSSPPSAPTVSTNPSTSLPPALKRKYDEIVDAITPGSAVKRRKKIPFTSMTTVEKLISASKHYTRGVYPFGNLNSVMLYGPEKLWDTPSATADSNVISIPASETQRQEECVTAFNKLFSMAPELLDVIKVFYLEAAEKPKQWDALVALMRTGATGARTTDTNALKHKLEYFLPNPTKDAILPPIPQQESKSDRGLSHPMLRYFLLPWRQRSKLPPLILAARRSRTISSSSSDTANGASPSNGPTNAPSSSNGADNSDDSSAAPAASSANAPNAFLKRIAENKIQLKSKSFPSCFYADGSYDPQDLDKGLLRGDVIPRVLRHLWTGPSSGIPGVEGKLPKGCNALAHNVFRVSPEMIGYAACQQARTMLGTKDWTERDGEYDYIELFNKVVKLFADPEDDWAKETLDWFQNELFGDAAAPVPQANDDEDSDEEDVMAQRAARRANPA